MNKKFKKIKRFTTASFAVWPFDPDKDLKRIHGRIVIIGLNPSARIKFGENFHRKRFDQWYEQGFSVLPFKGSYMTDLISHYEPNSSIIIKKWKNKIFRQRNVRNLKSQFKILGVTKSRPILCIGQNTKKLFTSVFPEFKYVLKINHPNSYRMKNKREMFLNDLKKIRGTIGGYIQAMSM